MTCTKCGLVKPESDFYRSKRGVHRQCKDCMRAYLREYKRANRERLNAVERARYAAKPKRVRRPPTERTCIRCERSLPYTDEYFAKVNPRGLTRVCRDCQKSRGDAWRREHEAEMKEYWREYQRKYAKKKKSLTLLRTYGITLEEFQAMQEAQGGCCAVCGRSDDVLVVDHCHERGHVRALLCNACNLALGLFNDDPDRLVAAAAYLIRHQERKVVPG